MLNAKDSTKLKGTIHVLLNLPKKLHSVPVSYSTVLQ